VKAIAVHPGKASSIHLADIPEPSVKDVPDGRGVLVEVLRVGVDGTDKEIIDAKYGAAPPGDDFLVTGHENFGRVLEFQSNGHSKYNGLTFDVNKRFSSNWQARLAYTYARAKDDHPDATIVVPGVDDSREAQDALNLGDEWAFSDTDVRNRVVLSGVWNLDYFGGVKNQLIYGMLSGWTLSGIISYQSGQPYTPVVSGDLNGDRNASNDRAPGAVRNSLRFPSQLSIDPRITRDIHIASNYHVQLIAEAFNLTNRSNVRTLRNTQFSYNAATNKLTQASLNPVTGYQSPSADVGPRTYQFAAKILF